MRYRKKPVVIEAWQFVSADPRKGGLMPEWINPAWCAVEIIRWNDLQTGRLREREGSPVIKIPTLEGVMTAQVGDWIIRGVKGEVYPCKPDIFEATYERVEEAS